MTVGGEPQFIGREDELKVLEELVGSGRPEFFVLYGRRRVGKTELLQRLCSGEHRAVYFLAAQVREKDNLRSFKEALKEGLGGDSLLDGIELPDWSAAPHVLHTHAQRVCGFCGIGFCAKARQDRLCRR